MKEIYLARQGKIHGPFDEEEIRRMQRSGELRNFVFRWDAASQTWKTIESPPALSPAEQAREAAAVGKDQRMTVICHDSYFAMVSGILENLTETGCDLVSEDDSDAPSLGLDAPLTINVLNPRSGKASNVPVRLKEALRTETGWIYRVRWKRRPEL